MYSAYVCFTSVNPLLLIAQLMWFSQLLKLLQKCQFWLGLMHCAVLPPWLSRNSHVCPWSLSSRKKEMTSQVCVSALRLAFAESNAMLLRRMCCFLMELVISPLRDWFRTCLKQVRSKKLLWARMTKYVHLWLPVNTSSKTSRDVWRVFASEKMTTWLSEGIAALPRYPPQVTLSFFRMRRPSKHHVRWRLIYSLIFMLRIWDFGSAPRNAVNKFYFPRRR